MNKDEKLLNRLGAYSFSKFSQWLSSHISEIDGISLRDAVELYDNEKTNNSSIVFEDDYIIEVLRHFRDEIRQPPSQTNDAQIIDRYACQLTAYMVGRKSALTSSAEGVDAAP